jgi:hypothetical protein
MGGFSCWCHCPSCGRQPVKATIYFRQTPIKSDFALSYCFLSLRNPLRSHHFTLLSIQHETLVHLFGKTLQPQSHPSSQFKATACQEHVLHLFSSTYRSTLAGREAGRFDER